MTEIADTINDAVEKAGASRINTIVAIAVAITATFTALCNVKDGNIGQAMAEEQASAIDAWAYYQAKSTKQSVTQAALDQLELQMELNAPSPAAAKMVLERKIADYTRAIEHYEVEKAEIRKTAQQHQENYEQLNYHDDQFDMADALMSIAIALFGITALTQKRALLLAALAFAGCGVLLGVAGFAGLHIHPKFLAELLS